MLSSGEECGRSRFNSAAQQELKGPCLDSAWHLLHRGQVFDRLGLVEWWRVEENKRAVVPMHLNQRPTKQTKTKSALWNKEWVVSYCNSHRNGIEETFGKTDYTWYKSHWGLQVLCLLVCSSAWSCVGSEPCYQNTPATTESVEWWLSIYNCWRFFKTKEILSTKYSSDKNCCPLLLSLFWLTTDWRLSGSHTRSVFESSCRVAWLQR